MFLLHVNSTKKSDSVINLKYQERYEYLYYLRQDINNQFYFIYFVLCSLKILNVAILAFDL